MKMLSNPEAGLKYVPLTLSLSTYIQWCVVKGEGVEGCFNPSPLLRNASDLRKVLPENFPNNYSEPTVNQDSPNKQLPSFFPVWLVSSVRV